MINHDMAPNISTRDQLLIGAVRLYRKAWGLPAGEWAAREAGLSPALTDIALDEDEPAVLDFDARSNDEEARIIVIALPGMPRELTCGRAS